MPQLVSSKPLNAGVTEQDLPTFFETNCGRHRTVLESESFPGLVIKKARTSLRQRQSQIFEVLLWQRLCHDGLAKFVPRHDLLYTHDEELILIVEYIEFTDYSYTLDAERCEELKLVEEYTPDTWPGENAGFTSDNRFILRDAGSPSTSLQDFFLQPA